ncbi:MAG: radical SAM protein [Candidatus Bathyarchaeia archaeon]
MDSNLKLTLSPQVTLRPEPQYYGIYMCFDYVKERSEFLDKDEFRILQYLRGKSSEVKVVAKETGVNYNKCVKFLERALRLGLVYETSEPPSILPLEGIEADMKVFSRFPVPFLSAPASVDIFITNRCNLNCIHCFSATDKKVDLPVETLQSLFYQLEEMAVLEVRINGGEPLLHPEIGEIIDLLEAKRFRKVLLTNGTTVDDEVAKQLKKANVIPTVSLDDSEASDHDSFRGMEGAFARTLEGLRAFRKNNVQYGINCCLHAKNLGKIDRIVKLAEKHGASRIAFLDLKPIGRMRSHMEWMPSRSEYEVAMGNLAISRLRHRQIDVSFDAFLYCTVPRESKAELVRGYISCRAGRSTLSISSDGSVYPCNVVIGDPSWKLGDLQSQRLRDIWFSERWASFRGAVKVSDLKKCGSCKEMRNCKYVYCRLAPYVVNGDPLGPSPYCDNI